MGLAVLVLAIVGLVYVLTEIAIRDPNAFFEMIGDSEGFARANLPAETAEPAAAPGSAVPV
jgi:hypothetical protein